MKFSLSSNKAWNFIHHNFASDWLDGSPIGNGDLGALVMATQSRTSFALAKSNVWDERCDDGSGERRSFRPFDNFAQLRELLAARQWDEIEARFEARRRRWSGMFALLPAATVTLDTTRFEKEIEMLEFHRHLGMQEAIATADYRTRVRKVHTAAFVSAEHEVLVAHHRASLNVLRGTPQRPLHLGVDISLDVQLRDETAQVECGSEGNLLWLRVRGYHALEYVVALLIVPNDARMTQSPSALTVQAREQGEEEHLDFTLLAAIVSIKDSDNPLREAVRRVHAAGARQHAHLKERHVAWWRNFWSASCVHIPDEDLLRQYHFGLYLLGSSSRPGCQMPGLQGLWTTRQEGSGWNEYTNDLNIQMTYWPIYTANHLELGWPYYETVTGWLPQARKDTAEYYGCRGAQFACCASPDGIAPAGYLTTWHWAGHAAFIAQNFWTHYQYSQDTEFLRDIAYPFLKECALFYLDFLKKDQRGLYEIWPSNTPEAGEGSYEAWGKNPVMDIALIGLLFRAVIEAGDVLGCDEELRLTCAERLKHWPAYPICNDRLMDMESKDFQYSHRHPGLLTPVYSCSDVEGEFAERTLDAFIERGRWLWCGFSPVWTAGAAARVGRGGQARDLLREFMEVYTLPHSGLHLNFDFKGTGRGHAGAKCFTNEANSGFSAALLEMLLQSHNGVIRVFPAVPDDWRDIAFQNLRAQGAFLVSASRVNGEIKEVTLHSERGGAVRLQVPWNGAALVLCESRRIETVSCRGILHWQTEANTCYRIVLHEFQSTDV